jgi:hypothetical protein
MFRNSREDQPITYKGKWSGVLVWDTSMEYDIFCDTWKHMIIPTKMIDLDWIGCPKQ